MTKRINRQYSDDFKLVLEQEYTIVQAAVSLGITDKILYNWVPSIKSKGLHYSYIIANLQPVLQES